MERFGVRVLAGYDSDPPGAFVYVILIYTAALTSKNIKVFFTHDWHLHF